MHVFGKESLRPIIGVVALVVSLFGLLICSSLQSQAGQSEKHTLLAATKKEKAPAGSAIVVLETTKGTIKIQLYRNEAPITSGNFLDLVRRNFYNGLTFHRYEPGFVIQGGDPNGNGTGDFTDPQTHKKRTIPLEVQAGLKHDAAGVVAMARSNDPNSASCQFYITLGPASFLDGNYAVFGKVIDGMSAVQQLRAGDKMTKVYELESK
jgi:cyclophilin family peptidyl-prolyl cis-trans isomerase